MNKPKFKKGDIVYKIDLNSFRKVFSIIEINIKKVNEKYENGELVNFCYELGTGLLIDETKLFESEDLALDYINDYCITFDSYIEKHENNNICDNMLPENIIC